MLKKQALVGAYGGFHSCLSSACTTSTSPAVLPIPRARPGEFSNGKRRKGVEPPQSRRCYATARGARSYDFRDNMNWPCHHDPKPSIRPSPYDIFELERGAAYSKHKFYELVKVYHPDRHNSATPAEPIHALSQVERIERYRLVVQAHEILSDPAKRRAYDSTGAGWGTSTSQSATYTYTSGTPESPFANATWEDWDRWYARTSHPHGAGPQSYEGAYFNHNAFASFIILTAIITGILQAIHASSSASGVEERARAFTAQTHQFLNDRKVDNARYLANEGSHAMPAEPKTPVLGAAADDRVRHFLQRRDPKRSGLKEEEEGYYESHFAGRNFAPPPKPASET